MPQYNLFIKEVFMLRHRDNASTIPIFFFILLGFMILFGACDSSDNEPEPVALETQLAEDVPADPASGRDPNTGRAIANNLYTLYDLDANEIVVSSSVTDEAQRRSDSTGTIWDIGFRGTTVIFNGGTSGPGEGSAQILTKPFDEVEEAPPSGYVTDGSNTECPSIQTPRGPAPGSTLAICTGSDNGWYNYDSSTGSGGLITPIPGRTIVLKTATGNYASLRFLSYYRGNPNPPDPSQPSRHYTFEFIVQPDGSRDLRNTTPSNKNNSISGLHKLSDIVGIFCS